jgi:hypothetical protein
VNTVCTTSLTKQKKKYECCIILCGFQNKQQSAALVTGLHNGIKVFFEVETKFLNIILMLLGFKVFEVMEGFISVVL